MNTAEISQGLLHILAHLSELSYKDFTDLKAAIVTTEFDAYFSPIFDEVDKFYHSRHEKFPDYPWVKRQWPSSFNTYIESQFLHSDYLAILDIVKHLATKNKALDAVWKDDFDKAVDTLTSYKQNASSNYVPAPTDIRDVFKDFWREKELFGQGVRTGIVELDTEIDFLPYKGFTTLVAPTKSFKTMTACNIVYDAVMNQSKNVVYLTLEDQYKTIWANLLCKHSYTVGAVMSSAEIKKYKLDKAKSKFFENMKTNFMDSMTGKLVVLSAENLPDFTPATVEAEIRKYEKEWGKVDMVVVDHFSIMDDPIPGTNLSGPALSKAYVRFMTKLSISFSEQGFVLLGLGQVTREYTEELIKGGKMRSTGVANTSEMERSATMMLCTYASDDMKNAGQLSITIVVNRNGTSGTTIIVPIKPEYSTIGEQYIEDFDDDTLKSIYAGDLDIPLKKNMNFGMSFTQFKDNLNSFGIINT